MRGQLAHRDRTLLHLRTKGFDGLIRGRSEGVFNLDLQNQLRAALEIEPQSNVFLQAFPAGRNAGKQENADDGNAHNDGGYESGFSFS